MDFKINAAGVRDRNWVVVGCPRCGGAILIEHSADGQSPGLLRVVPEDKRQVDVQHLPEDVRQYYKDAIRVLDAGVPDAAAVQLRRTLEAAAAHFGIDTGALVKRIRDLISAGLITIQFGNVLHHVRQLGNLGAHATDERVDQEGAVRALRFTTQVLRNLFEIPAELGAANNNLAAIDTKEEDSLSIDEPSVEQPSV